MANGRRGGQRGGQAPAPGRWWMAGLALLLAVGLAACWRAAEREGPVGDRMDGLRRWAADRKITGPAAPATVQIGRHRMNGLVASRSACPGEVLLSIPRKVLITADLCPSVRNPPERVAHELDKTRPSTERLRLRLAVMSEMNRGPGGFWWQPLAVAAESVGAIEEVEDWSAEALAAAGGDPQAPVPEGDDWIRAGMPVVDYRWSPRQDAEQAWKVVGPTMAAYGSWELFWLAWRIVDTRAFLIEGTGYVLAPIASLANHQPHPLLAAPRMDYGMSDDGEFFQFRTLRPLARGEQVFIGYTSGDATNHFLVNYGFPEPWTPHMNLMLEASVNEIDQLASCAAGPQANWRTVKAESGAMFDAVTGAFGLGLQRTGTGVNSNRGKMLQFDSAQTVGLLIAGMRVLAAPAELLHRSQFLPMVQAGSPLGLPDEHTAWALAHRLILSLSRRMQPPEGAIAGRGGAAAAELLRTQARMLQYTERGLRRVVECLGHHLKRKAPSGIRTLKATELDPRTSDALAEQFASRMSAKLAEWLNAQPKVAAGWSELSHKFALHLNGKLEQQPDHPWCKGAAAELPMTSSLAGMRESERQARALRGYATAQLLFAALEEVDGPEGLVDEGPWLGDGSVCANANKQELQLYSVGLSLGSATKLVRSFH